MKIYQQSVGLMGILVLGAWSAFGAPAGSSQVSLGAGAAIPTGANGLDNSQMIGLMGGARYLYQLTSNVGVGGQFDFSHLPGKTEDIGSAAVDATDNIYTGEIIGRYSFAPDAAWSPYLVAGVGVARTFQTTLGTPVPGATWDNTGTAETRETDHSSSTGYALSYGGGVERMLTQGLFCALEANWNTLGASRDRIGTSTFNFPDVSLRLGWQFGGK